MVKIYEFPQAKVLPDELKEQLRHIAENYVYVLDTATKYFYGDDASLDQIAEVGALVIEDYMGIVCEVVDEMDES